MNRDKEFMYTFDNNLFRKVYGFKSGIYYVVNNEFKDLRLTLKNNHYFEIFSDVASILNIFNFESLGNYRSTADLVLSKKQNLGIVELQNEIVQESSSFGGIQSALYKIDCNHELIVTMVKSSIYSSNYFSLFDVLHSTVFFENT